MAGATLLDNTQVLYGSNLGNASSHDTKNLSVVLAGGRHKHGSHIAGEPQKNLRFCNVFVSMLQNLGVETYRFGSSTGTATGI